MLSCGEGIRAVLPRFTQHTVKLWQVGRFVDENTKFTIYGKPARIQDGQLQIMGDYGFEFFQGNTHKILEIVVDESSEVIVPAGAYIFCRDGEWLYQLDTGVFKMDFSQSTSESP
jgi:hypothetical protein